MALHLQGSEAFALAFPGFSHQEEGVTDNYISGKVPVGMEAGFWSLQDL